MVACSIGFPSAVVTGKGLKVYKPSVLIRSRASTVVENLHSMLSIVKAGPSSEPMGVVRLSSSKRTGFMWCYLLSWLLRV